MDYNLLNLAGNVLEDMGSSTILDSSLWQKIYAT